MTSQPIETNVSMGRAADSYYMVIRIGGAHGQLVQIEMTAEQYAQLVTGQGIQVTGEMKTL